MTPLKSQLLGIALGLATAIGCIVYEKIIHNFSFMGFMIVKLIETLILCGIVFLFFKSDLNLSNDYEKVLSASRYPLWIVVYLLSGITTVLWFVITRHQGVMTSSIYEVKYIAMLAIIYIVFGDNKFTLNTAIGVGFAMASVYFISKS